MSIVTHIANFIGNKARQDDPCFNLLVDPDQFKTFREPRLTRVNSSSRTPSLSLSPSSLIELKEEVFSFVPISLPSSLELATNGEMELNPVTFVLGLHPRELWLALYGDSSSMEDRQINELGWPTSILITAVRELQPDYDTTNSRSHTIRTYHNLIDAQRIVDLVNQPREDELRYEYDFDPRRLDSNVDYVRDPWGQVQVITRSGNRNPTIDFKLRTSFRVVPHSLTYRWATLPYFYEVCLKQDLGHVVEERYFNLVLSLLSRRLEVADGQKARALIERMLGKLSRDRQLSILNTDMSLYPPMPLKFRLNPDLQFDLTAVQGYQIVTIHSPQIDLTYDLQVLRLLELAHPCLVKVVGVTVDDAFHLALVCEPHTKLTAEYLFDLGWGQRLRLCYRVAKAISYLNANNIIHDHLIPSRLVLDARGKIKVLYHSFTSSIALEERDMDLLPYRAPDVYHSDVSLFSTDVYALGYIIYYLLHAHSAFQSMAQGFILRKQLSQELPAIDDRAGPEIEELLRQTSYFETSKRPTIEQVVGVIRKELVKFL